MSEPSITPSSPVDDILKRLSIFVDEGEPDAVLNGRVPELAQQIAQDIAQAVDGGLRRDVEAMAALVGTFWCRYGVLPQEKDLDNELRACLKWSDQLLPLAPELVPSPIRNHLGGSSDRQTEDRVLSGYEILRAAAATPPRKEDNLTERLIRLGASQWFLREPGGRLQDFDALSVTPSRVALDSVPHDHPDRLTRLRSLLIDLRYRFDRMHDRDDLEEIIALGQECLDLAQPNDPHLPDDLYWQGVHLKYRFDVESDRDNLDAAIEVFHRMVALSQPTDLDQGRWATVAAALSSRYKLSEGMEDLDELIAAHRQILNRTPYDAPLRPVVVAGIGQDFFYRFRGLGQIDDLNEAISLTRTALDDASSMATENFDRATTLYSLGFFLSERFDRLGEADDLDAAITAFREAWTTTPLSDPDQFWYLPELAKALRYRYDQTGNPSDLDDLVAALRATCEAMPHEHPEWPDLSSRLGIELQARFQRYGNTSDLEDAIAAMRAGLDATPPDHPRMAGRLSNLAGVLTDRFDRTARPEDLDEAITFGRRAVDAEPNHPGYLANLGSQLQKRFERTGHQNDLAEAMQLQRRAVGAPDDGAVSTAVAEHNLAVAHQARYEASGLLEDLEAAISAERNALAATTQEEATSENRTTVLAGLSSLLHDRFNEIAQNNDLQEAIELGQAAVHSTPPDHPQLSARLNNLSLSLLSRFEQNAGPEDLDEAIALGRRGLDTTSPDDPRRSTILSNFGLALRTRYKARGSGGDLDEAVDAARTAVETTPNDHPDRTGRLSNLGTALYTRFERDGRREDLVGAVDAWRQSATAVNGPSGQRLEAAKAWGRAGWQADGPRAGLEGYTLAVEQLLPLRAWHGLNRTARERHLKAAAGLACQAAACALSANEHKRSLILLEAGRSIMWTSELQVHGDLSRLAGQAPELATALEATRRALDHTPPTAVGAAQPVSD